MKASRRRVGVATTIVILLVIVVSLVVDIKHHHSDDESNFAKYHLLPTHTNQTTVQQQGRRQLWLNNYQDPSSIALKDPFGASEVHYHQNSFQDAQTIPQHQINGPTSALVDPVPNLRPYNHNNIFITPQAFGRELFILYYDPNQDEFLVYIDEKKDVSILSSHHTYTEVYNHSAHVIFTTSFAHNTLYYIQPYYNKHFSSVWNRLRVTLPSLAYALRNHFPTRFQGSNSPEFITFVSTGDTPQLKCFCVNKEERIKHSVTCQNENFAPILQFGSVYKSTSILPNTVTMPVWPHLPCFAEWQQEGKICKEIELRSDVAGKVGGDMTNVSENSSIWDTLIPTVIWRGSDFFFLSCIHPTFIPIEWMKDMAPRMQNFGKNARGVIQSLLDLWDNLTPRWKAVTLTIMSQLDAAENNQQQNIPQWIDVKFTVKSKIFGKEVEPAMKKYEPFHGYGFDITSGSMSLSQLSAYKYHLDLGGGGGTTWYGTIEKLGMPGVLLHHLSSSKDYFHDDLVPW